MKRNAPEEEALKMCKELACIIIDFKEKYKDVNMEVIACMLIPDGGKSAQGMTMAEGDPFPIGTMVGTIMLERPEISKHIKRVVESGRIMDMSKPWTEA